MIFFPVKVSKKFNCEYNNSTHTAFSKIRAQIRVSYAFESKAGNFKDFLSKGIGLKCIDKQTMIVNAFTFGVRIRKFNRAMKI